MSPSLPFSEAARPITNRQGIMSLRSVQFLAVVLTALALIPSGAHFFELWNKIGLSKEQYFVVQGIYRGWAVFGFVLVGALAANSANAIMLRRNKGAFWSATMAAVSIAASLAIFLVWTLPANQATSNWTVAPPDWQVLRAHWEYSHAANAIVTFVAMCAVTLSVVRGSRTSIPRGAEMSGGSAA